MATPATDDTILCIVALSSAFKHLLGADLIRALGKTYACLPLLLT
jgi:hypothetical protein